MIRAVTPEDRAEWERLFLAYADFYNTALPDGALETVWGWIHDEAEPYFAALAIEDGQAVGLTQYQTMRRSLGGGDVVYLSDLYVDPAQRGKDLGHKLIDHVREHARHLGAADVRWLTAEDNTTARRLYDRFNPPSGFIMYKAGL
ncbi:N-acetyltransferase family protein [Paracoccaceae bacterium GXU_MW_L88]